MEASCEPPNLRRNIRFFKCSDDVVPCVPVLAVQDQTSTVLTCTFFANGDEATLLALVAQS